MTMLESSAALTKMILKKLIRRIQASHL